MPPAFHLPFGLEVGDGLGLADTPPEGFLLQSPLPRLEELEARSRGVGLPLRDLDAWMYFSRKWSSHPDVESEVPGIVANVVVVLECFGVLTLSCVRVMLFFLPMKRMCKAARDCSDNDISCLPVE